MLEKSTIMDLSVQGLISHENADELIRRVDEALDREEVLIEEEMEQSQEGDQ
jgi:hypothetical protein